METTEDKHWASKYLLDPLTAPDPSDETGPGAHYTSTFSPQHRTSTARESTDSKRTSAVHTQQTSIGSHLNYPTQPLSTSPRNERFPHRHEAFAGYENSPQQRRSLDQESSEVPTSTTGRQRGNSLTSRFSGDQTHRPLDIIKKETKLANRSQHLRKKHHVGADSIDSLDTIGGTYHHDGPYDATLLARNTSLLSSPIEAVRGTNEETLKATPVEKVQDSIEKHRPLDGVAIVPPGQTDREGRTYNYQEGTDLMVEGGYKRWDGVEYLPEDLKGKGEPSYSLEKSLKEHKDHRRTASDGNNSIEMTPRPQSSAGMPRHSSNGQSYSQWEGDMRRNNTTGRRASGGLKKRFGSLRESSRAE